MWPPMPSDLLLARTTMAMRVPADQALDAAFDLAVAGKRRLASGGMVLM